MGPLTRGRAASEMPIPKFWGRSAGFNLQIPVLTCKFQVFTCKCQVFTCKCQVFTCKTLPLLRAGGSRGQTCCQNPPHTTLQALDDLQNSRPRWNKQGNESPNKKLMLPTTFAGRDFSRSFLNRLLCIFAFINVAAFPRLLRWFFCES